jgi:hypothetical protein
MILCTVKSRWDRVLFKGLESSGYSFLLSLARHILRNYIFAHAIKNNLSLPIGKNITQNLDDFLEDNDTDNDDTDNNNSNNKTNSINIITQENQYIKKTEELYQLFSSDNYKHHFDWIRCEFFSELLLESLEEDKKNILKSR